jgi:hypothetical protein
MVEKAIFLGLYSHYNLKWGVLPPGSIDRDEIV